MKLFPKYNYNERSQKIERFMLKNKIFCLAVVVAVGIMIAGKISQIKENVALMNQSDVSVSEEQSEDEKVDTSVNLEETDNKDDGKLWRFYWIDLVVLVVGGGFCTIKIIQEKRKTKEKLQ